MPGRRKESSVIDDDIIIQAIKSGEEYEGGRKVEEIEKLVAGNELLQLFRTSTVARFSFMTIATIQNLNGFSCITKLCLDNNIIEEIQNIEHLINLKWLDLSFNRIRTIKGLTTLVNLVDVSLHSNLIRSIEGLDNCSKLECVSIGKNQISSLDILAILRPIHLKMLSLSGNPVCDEPEYRMMTLAFLTNLRYLDHSLVDKDDVNTAREQYQDELIDIEEKERLEAEKKSKDDTKKKHMEALTEAEARFGSCLFEEIISCDTELLKLRNVPGVTGKIEKFREKFKESADGFIEACMQKNGLRKIEFALYSTAISELYESNDASSRNLTESMSLMLKEAVKAKEDDVKKHRAKIPTRRFDPSNSLSPTSDAESRNRKRLISGSPHDSLLAATKVAELKQQANQAKTSLMGAELSRIEAFESMTDSLDTKWGEFKVLFLDHHQSFFRASETIIDCMSSEIRDVVVAVIDKNSQEDTRDDDIEEATQSLLGDKESVMSILTSSHDLQIGKMLKCEDEARERLTKCATTMFHHLRQGEHDYARKRILEISEMMTNTSLAIQELERSPADAAKKADDDDEFDN